MTVKELIEWLQAQDQAATIVIQDADADCFLHVRVGADLVGLPEDVPVPAGVVVIHGRYGEEYEGV